MLRELCRHVAVAVLVPCTRLLFNCAYRPKYSSPMDFVHKFVVSAYQRIALMFLYDNFPIWCSAKNWTNRFV